jgi:hypothetical protein
MAPVIERKVNLDGWGWGYFYLRLYVIIIDEPHNFSYFQWRKLKELSQEINNVLYCTTLLPVLVICNDDFYTSIEKFFEIAY